MAKEKNLTNVTTVAAADFVRVVTSAGASVKSTMENLAKSLLTTAFSGLSLGGSQQSVKDALDSLNSNIGADFTVTAGTNVTINSQRCQHLNGTTKVKFVWIMFTLSAQSGGVLFTGFSDVAVQNSIIPIYKVSATETAIYSMRVGTNGAANANGNIPTGQYVAMGIYA